MTNSSKPPFWEIALTGGIGSGKSAAASEFEKLGAAVIDSDALAHQITAPQGAAIPQIIKTFGADYLDAHGALNRSKMRELVFDDKEALRKLESITHPLIRQAGEKAASAAKEKNPSYLIFMIPLLFESNRWQGRFNKIIAVDCTVEQQIDRVKARNNLAVEAIQKIINAQVSRDVRNSNADYVIKNTSSWANLIKQVQLSHQQLMAQINGI
jgi:dephospho-CoA kinase